MGRTISPLAAIAVCALGLLACGFAVVRTDERPLPSANELAGEFDRSRLLDDRLAIIHSTREERDQILNDVLTGDISLDKAFECMRPLNKYEPICWMVLREHFPESSDEEILGYQLALAASVRAPKHHHNALQKLLTERLRQRFGPRVILPDSL
jgi:hypothetical protein